MGLGVKPSRVLDMFWLSHLSTHQIKSHQVPMAAVGIFVLWSICRYFLNVSTWFHAAVLSALWARTASVFVVSLNWDVWSFVRACSISSSIEAEIIGSIYSDCDVWVCMWKYNFLTKLNLIFWKKKSSLISGLYLSWFLSNVIVIKPTTPFFWQQRAEKLHQIFWLLTL